MSTPQWQLHQGPAPQGLTPGKTIRHGSSWLHLQVGTGRVYAHAVSEGTKHGFGATDGGAAGDGGETSGGGGGSYNGGIVSGGGSSGGGGGGGVISAGGDSGGGGGVVSQGGDTGGGGGTGEGGGTITEGGGGGSSGGGGGGGGGQPAPPATLATTADKKTDYTPWLVGGAVVVGLGIIGYAMFTQQHKRTHARENPLPRRRRYRRRRY